MQMVPGAQTINFAQEDLHKTLLDMTGGSGPDVGVEAVGMHYTKSIISKVHAHAVGPCMSAGLHPAARTALRCCRAGGGFGRSSGGVCMQCIAVLRYLLFTMLNLWSSAQAEQKLWLQTDPSDMMNDIIYNVRKVQWRFCPGGR